MNRRVYLAFVTLVLLIGAALRAAGIAQMADMVHYDEAYYAVDALSLLEQPRLNPFFLDNFGRESLWMYALTPALAAFGAGAFALRVTAFFAGMLTLAATGLLARVLFGRRAAIWTVAALGVLFWHVLMSHLAFRALLYPLIGALAWASLLIAWRTNRSPHWLIAGAAFGALGYTYFAVRGWVALGLVVVVLGMVINRERRRGLLIAAMMGVGIGAPLIFYLLATPTSAERLDQVVIADAQTLLDNLGVWLNVWVGHGADDPVFNLPGRPLLDVPLAVLAVVGLCTLAARPLNPPAPFSHTSGEKGESSPLSPFTWERGFRGEGGRSTVLLISTLLAVSIAPAVLTTEPLKWLRGIGIVVPLALILGAGAAALAGIKPHPLWLRSFPPLQVERGLGGEVRKWAWIIPAGLIAWAGVNSARDFQTWVTSDDLYMPMEQHLYRGIDEIAQHPEGRTLPTYFAPFTVDHPVLRFRQWRLGDRPVGAFKLADCLPLSESGGLYFGLNAFEPDLEEELGKRVIVAILAWGSDPLRRYWIFPTGGYPPPVLPPVAAGTAFGGLFDVGVANEVPDTLRVGESINLDVALRRVGVVNRAYTLFLHTYPIDQTRLLTQTDRPLCPSYPPTLWRDDETVIHTYTLPMPDQAGAYRVVLGIYDSETQERLPLGDGSDVATIGTIQVGDE